MADLPRSIDMGGIEEKVHDVLKPLEGHSPNKSKGSKGSIQGTRDLENGSELYDNDNMEVY